MNQPPAQDLIGFVLLVWLVIEPWTGLIIARNFLQGATRTIIPLTWRASAIRSGYLVMLLMGLLMVLFFLGMAHGRWLGSLVFYQMTVWYGVIITYQVHVIYQNLSPS
ncbi:hypothetical protein [Sulfobacillus thermosulfidooxidans]|uniref:hypothetical protein n=1 Tax=Sulfobacillus thermosulfidooxidans TaxID=28034 RepID=UPI000A0335A6|nr:hypothetical protein [Sulfobacillus thermosulfidooxidans]